MRPLFALMMTCAVSFASAQSSARPAWLEGHQGPRIGFSMATASSAPTNGHASNLLVGPLAGWYFEAPVHPQVSIVPELLYLTKGFNARNQGVGTRTRSTSHYFEVPVGIKVSTDKTAGGIFLLFGPSVGYLLSRHYQVWTNGQVTTDQKDHFVPANQSRFQTSVFAGIGMDGDKWTFDVRGMTSVTPFNRFQTVKNVQYMLTIAYRIAGKKAPPQETEE